MSISATEALGRLLSSAALRERLRQDPQETMDKLSVRRDQRHIISTLDMEELGRQAESLLDKRFSEVERLIPVTITKLGSVARCYFGEYAQTFWPQGHLRHVLDAASFAQSLLKNNPDCVCRSEINRLVFVANRRRFSCHLVRDANLNGRYQSALQFLYRVHGVPRQLLLYLSWRSQNQSSSDTLPAVAESRP
jgi:hypothetical protein